SLHEFEALRPISRPMRGRIPRQVFLKGHLFEHGKGAILEEAREALQDIQIGGRRGYGYGRVELHREVLTSDLFEASLQPEGVFYLPAGKPLRSHLEMQN